MKDNPFLSSIYVNKWIKHFNRNQDGIRFDFIKDVSFIKAPLLPVYQNVGKSLTKGISYYLSQTNTDYKRKVFLLYDIPDYFQLKTEIEPSTIHSITIKQYQGYLVDISKYNTIETYKKSKFGKSSLYKINKYKRKLESCFNISYKCYFGAIERQTYDLIFENFKEFLEKRFSKKNIHNNNLDPKEWNFYYDLFYDLILDKKASIFVIYNDNIPIGGSINYHTENTAMGAIMAFDTDYSKFYLGFTVINKLIEWSIDNKLTYFDFSKGKFDYKIQWSDTEYDFTYHILYDGNSITAKVISYMMAFYFRSKKYLRDKKINKLKHKLVFFIKRKKLSAPDKYNVSELSEMPNIEELVQIANLKNMNHLKKIIYDFLYSYSEHLRDIEVFQCIKDKRSFIIKGKQATQKISFA